MIWNRAAHGCCAGVLILVAAVAIRVCRRKIVVVIDVAQGTSGGGMGARQRPAGSAVIKGCSGPRNCIVTGRALGRRERRARRGMDRIVGALPGAQVTAGVATVRRLNVQTEIAVYVAQSALHVGMRIGQRKARGAMIEFAVGPLGDGVASRASRS